MQENFWHQNSKMYLKREREDHNIEILRSFGAKNQKRNLKRERDIMDIITEILPSFGGKIQK